MNQLDRDYKILEQDYRNLRLADRQADFTLGFFAGMAWIGLIFWLAFL